MYGDVFCLFGDIGKVQELVESAGNRDEILVVERIQHISERFMFGAFFLPTRLRQHANFFDLVQERLAVLCRHGFTEQLAKHPDPVTQPS